MIKKVFFGGLANLIYIIVLMVVNIIRTALAVRYLPIIETGIWFLFLNIIVITSFCDFGLSPTLSREIGFAYKKREPSLRISNLFFTVRRLVSGISLISIFFLVGFGYLYFYHLSIDNEQFKHILYAFYLFSIGIVIQFQSNPYLALIYGTRNIAIERYIKTIGQIFGVVIGAFFVVVKKYGIYGLVFGYLCQTLFIYVMARYFLYKIGSIKKGKYLKVITKRIFKPSMQWTIMSIGAILIFQTSNFVIAYLLDMENVAQFAVLFQIALLILTIAGVIGYVITPFVAQSKGQNENNKIYYFLTFSAKFSAAVALTLSIFFYFFIDAVVKIWLGPSFIVDHETLLILLIMVVFETHHVSIAAIAMATGYVKFAVIAIISGILNLLLSFIFIKLWGIYGAALAIFISQLLTNNWYVVFMSLRHLQYSLKKYLTVIVFPLFMFFIYVLLVVFGVYRFINIINIYLYLIFNVCLITVLVCVGGWFLLLSANEKSFIKLKMLRFLNA